MICHARFERLLIKYNDKLSKKMEKIDRKFQSRGKNDFGVTCF